MAPEHEARPRADFYDHESEEPRRRRRPAADWGVGEDIFDRMPSRRFSRTERRAEHHELVVRGRTVEPSARDATSWSDEDAWVDEPARGRTAEPRGRRDATSWGDEGEDRLAANEQSHFADRPPVAANLPAVDSWMDDDELRLVPGESRTIVLGADGAPEEPKERRTVKISGHPDRLPVPRTQRPPRTAVERIGARPDRIVAYAVALGFLLVLIAVLTTGQ